jgi:hypothetical protein
VGSPPLKMLDGLTCPKPLPWAKMPANSPNVGSGTVVVMVVVLGGTVVAVVVGPVNVVGATVCPAVQPASANALTTTSHSLGMRFVATKPKDARSARPKLDGA